MSTNLTTQQSAVVDHVATSTKSLVVEAKAGTGKTTVIIESIIQSTRQNQAVVAFNRAIADEVSAKLKKAGVDWKKCNANTVHSFGFSAYRKAFELRAQDPVDANKVRSIVDTMVGEGKTGAQMSIKAASPVICNLVSLAKQTLIGFTLPMDDDGPWYDIINHHGLTDDLPETVSIDRLIVWARFALSQSNAQTEVVDYDDMIYLPLLKHCRFWQFEVIFVDEAQDTNAARRALVRAMLRKGGKVVAVGDRCQPGDELISCIARSGPFGVKRRYQKRLDEIKVGDWVTTFNFTNAHEIAGRQVRGVTKRPYNGGLVVVETDSHKSRYTLNHRCVVKYPYTAGKFAVYIMCRGDSYRCGMTSLDLKESGCGLATRMRAEDADAVWLLRVFNTRNEAFAYEQVVSATHHVPQLMFTSKESTSILTQQELDDIWAQINNEEGAVRALEQHGRVLAYPLFSKGEIHATLKRPREVVACNLFEGAFVQLKGGSWVPAHISREVFKGEVVSLTVDREENYYANEILTHNCQAIYGFTGADSNALDLIKQDFNAEELPLSKCFRCAKAVVEHAQQWVPGIEWVKGGGTVRSTSQDEVVWADTSGSDVVLCRNNKPLVKLAYDLLKKGVPCYVEGRDVATSLVKLARKWKITTLAQLEQRLGVYQEREVQKALAKKQEQVAQSIEDKVETLQVFIDRTRAQGSNLITDLVLGIEKMFSDTKPGAHPDCLTLSSIHKSKGREWHRVFWLDMIGTLPSKYARQDWQLLQEDNLCYVAATRAEEELVHVSVEE